MARLASGYSAQRLAEIAGTSQPAIAAFELMYGRPEASRTAPLLRHVFEVMGIEFLDDCTVRFPASWNSDFVAATKAYRQFRLKRERLRGRRRRRVAADLG